MSFQQIFHEALTKEDKLSSLREELVRLRSEGIDKQTLISELTSYHDTLETEAEQDLVLDAMDYLVGWCSPHMRID